MVVVDVFVVYDNIKYMKKGWINCNCIQVCGVELLILLLLKKDLDFLDIREWQFLVIFDCNKLCNQIIGVYCYVFLFFVVMLVVEEIIQNLDENLFNYLWQGLNWLWDYFGFFCELIVLFLLLVNYVLKFQDCVIDICQVMNVCMYINFLGGMVFYFWEDFVDCGFELKFIQLQLWYYLYFDVVFILWLLIIDVMMFNFCNEVVCCFQYGYELI